MKEKINKHAIGWAILICAMTPLLLGGYAYAWIHVYSVLYHLCMSTSAGGDEGAVMVSFMISGMGFFGTLLSLGFYIVHAMGLCE